LKNFVNISGLFHNFLPAGSLRRSLVSGAFWSVCGAIFSRGFTLISSIVIARLLGKAGFGLWGLVLTTVSTFSGFASFGVSLTATKHVAELRKKDPLRAGRILSFALVMGLITVSIMSILCLVLSRWMAHHLYNAPELFIPLMLASIMLFCMTGTSMLQGALAGFEDFRYIARNNLIQGIVLFAASVPLTWLFGLTGTVIGMAISQCTALVLCLIVVLQKSRQNNMQLQLDGIWQERSIFWEYGVPGTLSGFVNGPASMLSQAMVANVASGISGLGGFNACAKWRDIILFVPGAVKQVTLPLLSRLTGQNEHRRFMKALWANIGLNGGIALIGAVPVMILSPWILSLYGPAFRQDWDMMVLLAGTTVFQAVNNVLAQVTACMGRIWLRFCTHIVWGIALITGSFFLVPIWGVRGYAWATALAVVLLTLANCTTAYFLIKSGCTLEKDVLKTSECQSKQEQMQFRKIVEEKLF